MPERKKAMSEETKRDGSKRGEVKR